MPAKLEVRASAEEFSRYRDLVDSDWNKSTLDAVLKLLWAVVRESADEYKTLMEWPQGKSPGRDGNGKSAISESFVERLAFLSTIFRTPYIPPMPRELVSGKSRLAAQAETTMVYLLARILLPVTGETGFFRDLQSLLYLNAVHYLLPQLKSTEEKGYASIINALLVHASVEWRDEPSHMFYLLASLMGELGHKEARLEFLLRALSATPIDDHSYLTKATAYWDELLDLGKQDKAMEFLLKLSRNVPEAYLVEIGEMITETAGLNPPA